ncbi:hypothetical protein OIU85_024418 [Salix viminalis]|uniref:RDRP C-terminal head domain-containing protein n=1 Tax=Salix viminalis TaxID=40686 RepID=A0A9Q0U0T1_SALVM|nr:hypothetical protein OIU85_024418 [Salix viminalis]
MYFVGKHQLGTTSRIILAFWGLYSDGTDRVHFLSFPWCVYDKLIKIKEEKTPPVRRLNRIVSFELEIQE